MFSSPSIALSNEARKLFNNILSAKSSPNKAFYAKVDQVAFMELAKFGGVKVHAMDLIKFGRGEIELLTPVLVHCARAAMMKMSEPTREIDQPAASTLHVEELSI